MAAGGVPRCVSDGAFTILPLPSGVPCSTTSLPQASVAAREVSRSKFRSASAGLWTTSSSLTMTSFIHSLSRLQVRAMEMAVSSLSPVSIHTWMPASRRASIVSGTPSCSLSSTAVAPSSSRFVSSRAAQAPTFSDRFSSDTLASLYSLAHSFHSSSASTRRPTQRVRKPRRA